MKNRIESLPFTCPKCDATILEIEEGDHCCRIKVVGAEQVMTESSIFKRFRLLGRV